MYCMGRIFSIPAHSAVGTSVVTIMSTVCLNLTHHCLKTEDWKVNKGEKNLRKLYCLSAKWILRTGPAYPRQASNSLLRMKSYLEIVFCSSLVRMRHEINLQTKDFSVDTTLLSLTFLKTFLCPGISLFSARFLQKFFMQRTQKIFGDFDFSHFFLLKRGWWRGRQNWQHGELL